jgi:O-antigen ligase
MTETTHVSGASTSRGVYGPTILQFAVLAYLVLLPLGHLVTFPVQGVWMTWSDALLGALIVVGVVEALRVAFGPVREPNLFSEGLFRLAFPALLLLLFAAWVALGSLWSFHPEYARLKGLGFGALGLGAVLIGVSGLGVRRAVDAWLVGVAATLILTWVGFIVGPSVLRERVMYTGGLVEGLPLPRLRGPFLHPNMFGDFLVVSGALLWARWGYWRHRFPIICRSFGTLLVLTIAATASSAWLGAGVLVGAIGMLGIRRRDAHRPQLHLRRPLPLLLLLAGLLLTTVTAIGLLGALDLKLGPLRLETGGIRPSIWASAWGALADSPVAGVGASPFLAEAADPRAPGETLALWDAHNAYLSVLGQFGLVGFSLIAVVVVDALRRLTKASTSRTSLALILAFVVASLHALVVASEEFRHLWVLLGLVWLSLSRTLHTRPFPGARTE